MLFHRTQDDLWTMVSSRRSIGNRGRLLLSSRACAVGLNMIAEDQDDKRFTNAVTPKLMSLWEGRWQLY